MENYTHSNSNSNTWDNNPFFIDNYKEKRGEIREHYGILRDDLVRLNQSLTINMNTGQGIPIWLQEIEIILPTAIGINNFVRNHLERDNQELLDYIPQFIQEINNHIENVRRFRNNLRPFIENEVREGGIVISSFPNQGFYFDEGYIDLMNLQLDRIIVVIRDSDENNIQDNLRLLREDFNSRYVINHNDNGFLLIGNFLIGRNNGLMINELEEILVNIPFRENILLELTNIYTSRLHLQEKLGLIQTDISNIIENINRLQYRTKADCCP